MESVPMSPFLLVALSKGIGGRRRQGGWEVEYPMSQALILLSMSRGVKELINLRLKYYYGTT